MQYDREKEIRLMKARFDEVNDQFLFVCDKVMGFIKVLSDFERDMERIARHEPISPSTEARILNVLPFRRVR